MKLSKKSTVFIVEGTHGTHEDLIRWVAGVFDSQESAGDFIDAVFAEHRLAGSPTAASWLKGWKSTLDPSFQHTCHDETTYSVTAFPILSIDNDKKIS